ncbi:MAG: P-loop containing nucleoside triphosphate hydrolase protein [Linnemannia elongata]|nr:MAG: P-loop containing nucleoside triphosphate hydrolase protein [Linnemannia elongata]
MRGLFGSSLYNIVLLGDEQVGKTSLITQLCQQGYLQSYEPTIENIHQTLIVVDNIPCAVNILDTSGREDCSVLRQQWIQYADAFILVYSITDINSLWKIEHLWTEIVAIKKAARLFITLVGNKSDRRDRQVSYYYGLEMAAIIGCQLIETNSLTGANVQDAFASIIRIIRLKDDHDSTSTTAPLKHSRSKKTCIVQ